MIRKYLTLLEYSNISPISLSLMLKDPSRLIFNKVLKGGSPDRDFDVPVNQVIFFPLIKKTHTTHDTLPLPEVLAYSTVCSKNGIKPFFEAK